MLETLRDDDFKVEAFVSWLAARGIHVDRSLVSHWTAGRTHLPADVLPLLAEFSGRPDVVYGPYVRPLGWEVVAIPKSVTSDEDLIDLMLSAGAHLGRLHEALADARSPDSPGGGGDHGGRARGAAGARRCPHPPVGGCSAQAALDVDAV